MLPIEIEPAALNVRSNFWAESLAQLTYVRDFACVFLLWHVLHVGANVRLSSPAIDCAYFGAAPLAAVGASLLLYLASLMQRGAGAWAGVADVPGLAVGVFLQVASKPAGWALSTGTEECSLVRVPYGEFAFFAGEVMAFSVPIRIALHAFARTRDATGRALVLVGLLLAAIGTGFGLDALIKAVVA